MQSLSLDPGGVLLRESHDKLRGVRDRKRWTEGHL
jgi:hypothetical protein